MRVIGIISVRQLETGVGTILILTSVALNIVFRAAYFDHVVALTMGAEYFLIAGHQVTPKIGRALDLSIMQNLCLAHYPNNQGIPCYQTPLRNHFHQTNY